MKTVKIEIPLSLANRISTDHGVAGRLVNTWLTDRYPPNRTWLVQYPYSHYVATNKGRRQLEIIRRILNIPGNGHKRIPASFLTIRDIEHIRGYRSTRNGQDYIIDKRHWSAVSLTRKTFMKRLLIDLEEARGDYES